MSETLPLAVLERINAMLLTDFTDNNPFQCEVNVQTERLPLVKATAIKQTRSFSAGQKGHIYGGYWYGGYWGMNERALVVARYRRKHAYIFGVVPIKNLGDFSPDYVYHPAVLGKFRIEHKLVDARIFSRFFDLPHHLGIDDYRRFLRTGRYPRRATPSAEWPINDKTNRNLFFSALQWIKAKLF